MIQLRESLVTFGLVVFTYATFENGSYLLTALGFFLIYKLITR